MIESIDTSLIDWSRAQFAMTAMYHWIFVPLTLGLAVVMGIMETLYYKTGKEFWKNTAKFWMKLFGINFAVGVATGLILEFEFGTNWSNYSWFVGDIFGAPLAIEGILAFFMEATFIAVMFFGWEKVSKRFHLASTWLTGLGATISAWWILVANAWMQNPVGMEFNPDSVRNEMVDFWAVAFSPVAVNKFFHTVLSGWVLGAIFVVGVSCWFLLKKRDTKFAMSSIKIGAIFGLVASLLSLWTGDGSGYQIAQTQPMKLAAVELDRIPRNGRDFWRAFVLIEQTQNKILPDVSSEELARVWQEVLAQAQLRGNHTISRQELSVREFMSNILRRLGQSPIVEFRELFKKGCGIEVAIVNYLAILELAKDGLVRITQAVPFAPLYVARSEEFT